MANSKSAAKRARQTIKRTARNKAVKSKLRTDVKRFETAIVNEDKELAQSALHRAIITIDKAVTKGVLHKNKAARTKSRLTKRLNELA